MVVRNISSQRGCPTRIVHFDQPDTVIEAILEMMETVRSQ